MPEAAPFQCMEEVGRFFFFYWKIKEDKEDDPGGRFLSDAGVAVGCGQAPGFSAAAIFM